MQWLAGGFVKDSWHCHVPAPHNSPSSRALLPVIAAFRNPEQRLESRLSLRLGTQTRSFLPHSTGQHKYQIQPRFREWSNKFHLLVEGAENNLRPCAIYSRVNLGTFTGKCRKRSPFSITVADPLGCKPRGAGRLLATTGERLAGAERTTETRDRN